MHFDYDNDYYFSYTHYCDICRNDEMMLGKFFEKQQKVTDEEKIVLKRFVEDLRKEWTRDLHNVSVKYVYSYLMN